MNTTPQSPISVSTDINHYDMQNYYASIHKEKEEVRVHKEGTYDTNYQMQQLLTKASDIRKSIAESKTSTKKQYYTKKFAKVQKQAIQMVMAIDQMNKAEALMEESANASAVSPI